MAVVEPPRPPGSSCPGSVRASTADDRSGRPHPLRADHEARSSPASLAAEVVAGVRADDPATAVHRSAILRADFRVRSSGAQDVRDPRPPTTAEALTSGARPSRWWLSRAGADLPPSRRKPPHKMPRMRRTRRWAAKAALDAHLRKLGPKDRDRGPGHHPATGADLAEAQTEAAGGCRRGGAHLRYNEGSTERRRRPGADQPGPRCSIMRGCAPVARACRTYLRRPPLECDMPQTICRSRPASPSPDAAEPDDLDEFWAATLTEARTHPLDAAFEQVQTGLTVIDTWGVTFRGFGGSPVRALHLSAPDRSQRAVRHRRHGGQSAGAGRGRGRPSAHRGSAAEGRHPEGAADILRSHDRYGVRTVPTGRRGGGGDRGRTRRASRRHLLRGTYYYWRIFTDAVPSRRLGRIRAWT